MLTKKLPDIYTLLFSLFGGLVMLLFFVGLKLDLPLLTLVPFIILAVVWGFTYYKTIFFVLLFTLPLSVEFYFSNSLATDIPTEPIMLGLTGIGILLLITKIRTIPIGVFKFMPMLLLLLHLFWIFICAINSENQLYSFKATIAKIWYYIPFTILPIFIIKNQADLKKIFWCLFIPLSITIIVSMLRHGIIYQFAFDKINQSIGPYFRNHVNYAAMISIFFPWLWVANKWYPKNSIKNRVIQAAKILFILAIYFSYTRTCMIALLAMIPFYFIIKWNLMKPVIIIGTIVSTLIVGFLLKDNYYMRFAPDYKKTIYHDDFGSHLSSTFEGKDVSSMERVYRWVAAVQMVSDRPWMGIGSGNFYDFYKKYEVSDFRTYISENEERSTVHNYFLLMLVEHGSIGFIIFISLTLSIFWSGSNLYHSVSENEKWFVMILLQCLMAVFINLMLSDMLESDKVGPFFYLSICFLAMIKVKLLKPKELDVAVESNSH